MKLNLSTTWTKKKMASLFLMGLSVSGVEGGQVYKDCLSNLALFGDINSNFYNSLLPYANNNLVEGERLEFCGDSTHYVLKKADKCSIPCCSSSAPPTDCVPCVQNNAFLNFGVNCTKIAQSMFCSLGETSCGGIIGDTSIINNYTLGTCSDFNGLVNSIAKRVSSYSFNLTSDGNVHAFIFEGPFCPKSSTHPNDDSLTMCY